MFVFPPKPRWWPLPSRVEPTLPPATGPHLGLLNRRSRRECRSRPSASILSEDSRPSKGPRNALGSIAGFLLQPNLIAVIWRGAIPATGRGVAQQPREPRHFPLLGEDSLYAMVLPIAPPKGGCVAAGRRFTIGPTVLDSAYGKSQAKISACALAETFWIARMTQASQH